jgi:hypothetical protein
MLVDHPYPVFNGIPGGVKLYPLAVNENLPFIRPVKAIQDVHEGTLAGPVFTQQRMDFSLSH